MFFAVLITRMVVKDILTDCCFCFTNILDITAKSKRGIQYPSLPSVIKIFLLNFAGSKAAGILGYRDWIAM